MLSVSGVAVNAAAASTVNAKNVKDVGLKDAPLPSLFPVEPAPPAPVSVAARVSMAQLPVIVLVTVQPGNTAATAAALVAVPQFSFLSRQGTMCAVYLHLSAVRAAAAAAAVTKPATSAEPEHWPCISAALLQRWMMCSAIRCA
jgi:hypothetical protein